MGRRILLKSKFDQVSNGDLKSYTSCKDATKKFNLPKKSKLGKEGKKPVEFNGWFYYNKEGKLLNPDMQD